MANFFTQIPKPNIITKIEDLSVPLGIAFDVGSIEEKIIGCIDLATVTTPWKFLRYMNSSKMLSFSRDILQRSYYVPCVPLTSVPSPLGEVG